jgi:hypothetical protein
MTYDNYKLETPSSESQCEMCGEWGEDYIILTADGQRWGQLLCPGCYDEMVESQRQEREAAFVSMMQDE